MMDYGDLEEDTLGMTLTSGTCTLKKDTQNLVGISIGGGAPLCPCLYIVQIFDNTAASKDGSLAAGDEIVSVNGKSVKGRTKVEVAKLIQASKSEVTIHYNKLHAQPKEGKTLDIVLKKMKHRIVETMSSTTADALGLSRAILCNDGLIKKLDELERTSELYRGLIEHTRSVLKAIFELAHTHRNFGDAFANIGAREPQFKASEAFTKFGEAHRQIDRHAITLLRTVKPMIADLNTYLTKAIPDTKLTIEKYADAKFEYLSYCLKVKEMDDEECSYAALQEPLYRVETGNYEYRLILRCRQLARERFAKMRADVLVKLELLDQKHVQDIVFQLHRFITALDKYHKDCNDVMKEADIFPIEVDLTIPTLRGLGNDDADDIDNENDEANGNDLFNDDQQESASNQPKTVEDVDLLNIVKMRLQTKENQSGPLAVLKAWRDKKYAEIDQEYNKKIQEFNRKIIKQEQEVSQTIENIKELINEGEASSDQVKQLKNKIEFIENQVNKLMTNEQMQSSFEDIIDKFNLINTYVQFGRRKCLVKGKVFCRGKNLYALECEMPLTGYDGLCPKCRDVHISLQRGRGFYVSCETLHEKVAQQYEKQT
ncbi:unnamed protein product [Rotaria sp. Silwood1]|nr:unnamed protein product [Rotaria sp. Silwood1]